MTVPTSTGTNGSPHKPGRSSIYVATEDANGLVFSSIESTTAPPGGIKVEPTIGDLLGEREVFAHLERIYSVRLQPIFTPQFRHVVGNI